MVALAAGRLHQRSLLSINHLTELRFIHIEDTTITLGANTTFTDIRRNPTIATDLPLLTQSASWTGSIANQNRATLGGNLCNASPAADTPSSPPRLQRGCHPHFLSRPANDPLHRLPPRLQAHRPPTRRAPPQRHHPPPLRRPPTLHPQSRHPQRASHLQDSPRRHGPSQQPNHPGNPPGRSLLSRPPHPPLRHRARPHPSLPRPIRLPRHPPPRPRRPRHRIPPHRRHPLHRPLPQRRSRQPPRPIPPHPRPLVPASAPYHCTPG